MSNVENLVKTAYVYDEDGYFEDSHIAQPNPRSSGKWFFPPRSTIVKPAMQPKTFYKIRDTNNAESDWDAIPYPASAEDFVGIEIPHQSRTQRSNILRMWLRKFVAENPTLWREKQINDADGNLQAITIEAIPQPTAEEKAAQLLAVAKGDRAAAVSKIIVTVERKNESGKTVKFLSFDGDEEAQTRMSRTIVAAQALGVDLNTETRTWVMSDNSIEQVTIDELAQALRLAGDAQTALWTVPYEE